MKKKGVESVEVWMWIIAGFILGGLIFVSSYSLLSNWIRNNEVDQAQKSFQLLQSSMSYVCSLGEESQEIKSYVFPYLVNNISIKNETSEEYGRGDQLCMDIQHEGEFCAYIHKDKLCRGVMNAVDLSSEESLFYLIQKARGKSKNTKIRFQISKTGKRELTISWSEEFLD